VTTSPANRETLRGLYTRMRRIRGLEEAIITALSSGQFASPYYPVKGLEAACGAIGTALRSDDYVVSTYRCLGDVVAKGVPMREIAAEMYGKVTGTSKGKGGAMHMAAPHHGLMATTGIVGAGAPIANGLALAAQLRRTDQVTAVTFGDGATSIGAMHESLNLAALWGLSVIFVCQNNQWGEHTSLSDYTKGTRLVTRAEAVGMRGVQVDGFDAIALLEAVTAAVATARDGGGPTFIESITYRLRPHSFGNDDSYVNLELLNAALAREPVQSFRDQLAAEGWLSETDLDAVDAAVAAEVSDAMEFAAASQPTPMSEMLIDVFA
jgi:pyruvate dehydrogenase E1 component alpha subunit